MDLRQFLTSAKEMTTTAKFQHKEEVLQEKAAKHVCDSQKWMSRTTQGF